MAAPAESGARPPRPSADYGSYGGTSTGSTGTGSRFTGTRPAVVINGRQLGGTGATRYIPGYGYAPDVNESAYARRSEPGYTVGTPTQETFFTMGRDGTYARVPSKYYNYTTYDSIDEATATWDNLSADDREVFEAIARTQGAYEGQKSGISVYADALLRTKALQADGEFWAPIEIAYRNLKSGAWEAKWTTKEEDEASGGSPYGGGGGFGGGGGGGGTVNLTTDARARYYVEQAYKSILGRAPKEGEVEKFTQTLREAEMANPSTVSFEGDLAVQSGGFDPQILAEQQAEGAEDFKSRKGGQYMRWLMDGLAGGV